MQRDETLLGNVTGGMKVTERDSVSLTQKTASASLHTSVSSCRAAIVPYVDEYNTCYEGPDEVTHNQLSGRGVTYRPLTSILYVALSRHFLVSGEVILWRTPEDSLSHRLPFNKNPTTEDTSLELFSTLRRARPVKLRPKGFLVRGIKELRPIEVEL
ncbi:hypothetical protein J6590_082075 [Homalodisca vitripennis]|nr:hypothetical protein J6590_082075 [Homalodisca vitripennis]